MQHALDLDRGDGCALQRRKEHAAKRVAERQAEAALERFGGDGRLLSRLMAPFDAELLRFNEFLPVLLKHIFSPSCPGRRERASIRPTKG